MLLKELRAAVLEANLELVKRGLVLYTFGNASGVDREQGLVVIKPSGVDYAELRPEHMVVTDLHGKIVEGELKPSSDLDTHTLLYREFTSIGAVVHTHSEYATSFAQAGLAIPALGTTHADYFYGPVPVTEALTDEAIGGRYVHETGNVILLRTFSKIQGLASLRIGYGLANPDLIRVLAKTRQPFNANAIAQVGAIAGLQDNEHQEKTRALTLEGVGFLQSEFDKRGLEYVPSSANFVLVKVGDGKAIFDKLLRRGTIVRATGEYKLPEWIRVSVGTIEQNHRFLEDLDAVMAE